MWYWQGFKLLTVRHQKGESTDYRFRRWKRTDMHEEWHLIGSLVIVNISGGGELHVRKTSVTSMTASFCNTDNPLIIFISDSEDRATHIQRLIASTWNFPNSRLIGVPWAHIDNFRIWEVRIRRIYTKFLALEICRVIRGRQYLALRSKQA